MSKPEAKLFYHPSQTASSSELSVAQGLSASGLLDLCLTITSGYIENWLEHPETYPEEFKSHVIAIWRSNDGFVVPCLVWNNATKRVGVEQRSFNSLRGKIPTIRVM
jgi:hypothetical protein